MADSREVMNIRQASQYLGVSPDTLYKYVSEERIPAFKLGNRWRFKKTLLDAWMEQQSSAETNGNGKKKKSKAARAAETVSASERFRLCLALVETKRWLGSTSAPAASRPSS
jgi:excisionase family DNA binding protein